jgi:plastocyanin
MILEKASAAAKLRRMKSLLALLLAIAPIVHAGAAVEGKVNLSGVRTPMAPPNARYQTPVKPGPPEPPAAVVYLEGSFPGAGETDKVLEVGQKKYQFAPGLLPVQTGTTIKFPNFDDDYHNVFSLSESKRFDLGKYLKGEEAASQKFTKPGVVKLFCEIHKHMRGTILVLDTPYFVKTDKDGNYRLKDLPTGSYKLKAWLNEKVWERAVELKDGETLTVNFSGK